MNTLRCAVACVVGPILLVAFLALVACVSLYRILTGRNQPYDVEDL